MKKLLYIAMLLIACSFIVSGQSTAKSGKNPTGKWTFEAPYAPEGYQAGSIEITFSENKYHAAMVFANSNNPFPGGNVTFEKDTLRFTVFVENQDVAVSLALAGENKMAGKAVYSEGVVPLALTKEIKKD